MLKMNLKKLGLACWKKNLGNFFEVEIDVKNDQIFHAWKIRKWRQVLKMTSLKKYKTNQIPKRKVKKVI